MKVLRPRDGAVPWTAIEVRRDPGGWVEVELSGAAAELAEAAGVAELAVSLTHEGEFAAAVVVADDATTIRGNVTDEIRQIIAEHGRLAVEWPRSRTMPTSTRPG